MSEYSPDLGLGEHIAKFREQILEKVAILALIRQCKEIGRARMQLPGVDVEVEINEGEQGE